MDKDTKLNTDYKYAAFLFVRSHAGVYRVFIIGVKICGTPCTFI